MREQMRLRFREAFIIVVYKDVNNDENIACLARKEIDWIILGAALCGDSPMFLLLLVHDTGIQEGSRD